MKIYANANKPSSRRKVPALPQYETPFTELEAALEEMDFLSQTEMDTSFSIAIGVTGNLYVLPTDLAEGLKLVETKMAVNKTPMADRKPSFCR